MMYKDDMRQGLKGLIEIIDSDFRKLNNTQKGYIEDSFNTHIEFEYIEDGGYIFIMEKNDFKKFEHYLGMAYDREYIESNIIINNTVMATYSYDSTRAEALINTLNELSEE